MFNFDLPVWANGLMFLGAAAVIGLAGVRTAAYADRLADRTGLGEAITGTVFLGFITALPGLVASVVAALKGHAAMAIANAMGGIAVQTVGLAVADLTYRRANLEHAAASVVNMLQTAMLILLIVLTLVGMSGPAVTIGHVHPMTVVLFVAAGCAFWLALRTRREPMWQPTQTRETISDQPVEEHQQQSLSKMIFGLIGFAGATAIGGAFVAEASENLLEAMQLSEVVIGGLFLAIATSLPELVTSIAAVRRGALTLAVSDVVGGNFFDVLFVAAADLAYFQGSLYHGQGVGYREVFLTSLTILLNVVLLTGLIYRQEQGPARIGFESLAMLVLYLAGFLILSLAM